MRLRTLLFSGLGWWMVVQEQAAAWTHVKPAPMPTSASSPSSYLGAPGGTVKVSKMSHRLHRRCFLPHASSGDGEGDNIAGGEKRLSTPAASSSNDDAALTFARIVIESNQATIEMVDGKLEKALDRFAAEIKGLKSELQEELKGLKSEFKGEFKGFKSELQEELKGLKSEFKKELKRLKGDIKTLRFITLIVFAFLLATNKDFRELLSGFLSLLAK